MTALKLQLQAFGEQLGNDAKLTERFDKVLKLPKRRFSN
jgi:hypothetical protein